MEGKISVKELLYKKDQIEKYISELERLTSTMFQHSEKFAQIFTEANVERVSSFDVNGATNYLRDYLKIVDHAINTAEADWPL